MMLPFLIGSYLQSDSLPLKELGSKASSFVRLGELADQPKLSWLAEDGSIVVNQDRVGLYAVVNLATGERLWQEQLLFERNRRTGHERVVTRSQANRDYTPDYLDWRGTTTLPMLIESKQYWISFGSDGKSVANDLVRLTYSLPTLIDTAKRGPQPNTSVRIVHPSPIYSPGTFETPGPPSYVKGIFTMVSVSVPGGKYNKQLNGPFEVWQISANFKKHTSNSKVLWRFKLPGMYEFAPGILNIDVKQKRVFYVEKASQSLHLWDKGKDEVVFPKWGLGWISFWRGKVLKLDPRGIWLRSGSKWNLISKEYEWLGQSPSGRKVLLREKASRNACLVTF